MSESTKEIESDAVREIEPELRDLFTKVVERDPREAVKMLEPYPDEFVVQMLELLNPAPALIFCNASIQRGGRRSWLPLPLKTPGNGCAIKPTPSVPSDD
jgi:hypothetical protein